MADDKFKDEILNDEQLDSVAGGTRAQTNDDIYYLRNRCGVEFPDEFYAAVGKLNQLYEESGIHFSYNSDYANQYVLQEGNNYSYISREEARYRVIKHITEQEMKLLRKNG